MAALYVGTVLRSSEALLHVPSQARMMLYKYALNKILHITCIFRYPAKFMLWYLMSPTSPVQPAPRPPHRTAVRLAGAAPIHPRDIHPLDVLVRVHDAVLRTHSVSTRNSGRTAT